MVFLLMNSGQTLILGCPMGRVGGFGPLQNLMACRNRLGRPEQGVMAYGANFSSGGLRHIDLVRL
jgi:hypothetical protein